MVNFMDLRKSVNADCAVTELKKNLQSIDVKICKICKTLDAGMKFDCSRNNVDSKHNREWWQQYLRKQEKYLKQFTMYPLSQNVKNEEYERQ